MPNYDYECSACGYRFEELQSMTAPKLTKCPSCGQEKLARLIGSGSGVIFKGAGFYETDYKKKSEPNTDKQAAPACDKASCPMKASGACGA